MLYLMFRQLWGIEMEVQQRTKAPFFLSFPCLPWGWKQTPQEQPGWLVGLTSLDNLRISHFHWVLCVTG